MSNTVTGVPATAVANASAPTIRGADQVRTGTPPSATAYAVPPVFSILSTNNTIVGVPATATAYAVPPLIAGGSGLAAARFNLCTNPSFEVDLTDWDVVAVGTPPVLSQDRSFFHATSGSLASMQILWQANGTTHSAAKHIVPVTYGAVYRASCWALVPTGSPPLKIGVGYSGYGDTTIVNDLWQPLSYDFVAFASTAGIGIWADGPQQIGQAGYVDDVWIEQIDHLGAPPMPYFSGASDQSDAYWTGTPELSTSGLLAYDPTSAAPQIVVEFDARPPQPGEFIIGQSLLGGTDTLTTAQRWVTVDIGVRQGSIVRGRPDPNSDVQVGQATLVYDNQSGDFDSDNIHSRYNQVPAQPYLVKGMLCRISAYMPTGGQYAPTPLFVGRLETVACDKGWDLAATLTFVDDLAVCASTGLPSSQLGIRSGDLAGTRAQWLINQLPPVYGTPSISPLMDRVLLPTFGGGSVLQELDTTANAQAGRVFIDRAGNLTITSHGDDLLTSGNVLMISDLDSPANSIEADSFHTPTGRELVVTAATVDRYTQGGDATYPSVYGGSSAHAARYGGATLPWVAPLANTADAQSLADYLGNRRSRPMTLIDGVTVGLIGNPNAAALLTTELGDPVTAQRTAQYTSGMQQTNLGLTVEGLQWSFSPTSFAVTIVAGTNDSYSLYGGSGVFIIGQSFIGGPDVLASYV